MPVDPSQLRSLRKGPPKPTKPSFAERWVNGWTIALVGSLFFGVFGLAAIGSVPATRGYAACLAVLVGGSTFMQAVEGWNEDGFVGMIYRLRRPFGSTLLGEDRQYMTGRWTGVMCVIILAAVFLGYLWYSAPKAFPLP
jgi:hypothetical protein